MRVDSFSLIPFSSFSGSVLIVTVALGPSPSRVTPARLMLYFAPGVKFSKRCFVAEADMLWHSDEMRCGKTLRKLSSQLSTCSCLIGLIFSDS